MANIIDLESKHFFLFFSTFETRSSDVLELMKSFFGPVFFNPVQIEPSIVIENWLCFKIISDVNFTVNSPLSRVSCLV